jgi:hypothetical protein
MSRKPISLVPPFEESDDEPVGEALAAAREQAAARKRWTPSRKQLGIGAAVGIGSAAIVAGLLYWRGNRK